MCTTEDHATIIIVRWIMLEPDSAAIEALRPLLDESERAARADRFRIAADRDAYIAAHALLRTTLSRVAGASVPRIGASGPPGAASPCLTPPRRRPTFISA